MATEDVIPRLDIPIPLEQREQTTSLLLLPADEDHDACIEESTEIVSQHPVATVNCTPIRPESRLDLTPVKPEEKKKRESRIRHTANKKTSTERKLPLFASDFPGSLSTNGPCTSKTTRNPIRNSHAATLGAWESDSGPVKWQIQNHTTGRTLCNQRQRLKSNSAAAVMPHFALAECEPISSNNKNSKGCNVKFKSMHDYTNFIGCHQLRNPNVHFKNGQMNDKNGTCKIRNSQFSKQVCKTGNKMKNNCSDNDDLASNTVPLHEKRRVDTNSEARMMDDELKYCAAEFNSILRLTDAMQKSQQSHSKNETAEEIEKINKNIMQKAAARVNIPFGTRLYKDLTPLDEPAPPRKAPEKWTNTRLNDPEPDIMELYDQYVSSHQQYSIQMNLPKIDPPQFKVPANFVLQQHRLLQFWGGEYS